jgi:hypothetical protein
MKNATKIFLFATLGIAAIGIPLYLSGNKKNISNGNDKGILPPTNPANQNVTPGGKTGNDEFKSSVIPGSGAPITPEGWKGGTVPKKLAKVIPTPEKTEQQKWAEEFVQTINSNNELRSRADYLLKQLSAKAIINSSQQSNILYGHVYQYLDKNKVKQHMPVYYQMYDMSSVYNNDYAKLIVDISATEYQRKNPGKISEYVVESVRNELQIIK